MYRLVYLFYFKCITFFFFVKQIPGENRSGVQAEMWAGPKITC